jgi:hypothetical protein
VSELGHAGIQAPGGPNRRPIAHAEVDREIRAKDDAKHRAVGADVRGRMARPRDVPDWTVADEESVELGDLRFTAWDFGSGA